MINSKEFNFNEFYKNCYRKTFLFAKSYVHDQWAAEDIASESLISMWEILKKNEINHPETFLFSIVKNKSIDHLRKELNKQESLLSLSEIGIRELKTRISTLEAFSPEMIYSEEVKDIINRTLNSLPDVTREVFLMSRFQNLSKKEIAVLFNISTKGVEYHISKALAKLKISLKDYLPISSLLLFSKYIGFLN